MHSRTLPILAMRAIGVISLTALGLSGLSSTPAGAATPQPGGITITAKGIPSSASEIIVEAESPLTGIGVPRRLYFYYLARARVSGTSVTVKVPPSRFLSSVADAQHGNVNLAIIAESPRRSYSRMAAVHLSSRGTATLAVAGISRVSYRQVASDRLSSTPHVGQRACASVLEDTTEGVTRIGELHVANVTGEGGSFTSSTTTDNTISVGASETGDTGSFSADGTVTLSNSISANGGFSETIGYTQYVNGHVYYGKYLVGGNDCSPTFMIQATSSAGDAFPGTNQAPTNPYGSCHADPNGLATVAPLGHYDTSNSHSKTYSGAFHWFGFAFSGSDGFTTDVAEGWVNRNSTQSTYVCGDAEPVQDSHIFWNGAN